MPALQPRHGNIKSSIVCLPSRAGLRLNCGVIITHHHLSCLAITSNVRRQPGPRLRAGDARQSSRQLSKHSSTATAFWGALFFFFFFFCLLPRQQHLILNSRRGAVIIAKSTWQILFEAALKLLPSICVT